MLKRDRCSVFTCGRKFGSGANGLAWTRRSVEGGIGPGHLKIADHSWHDTQTLAPLLPVLRVMGKAKVEVLSVK